MTTNTTHNGTIQADFSAAKRAATAIQQVAEAASKVFFEREDAITALSLALTSGTHAMLWSAPGLGKSSLISYFANSLGWKFFRRTMGIDTTTEELFGPLSPKEMLEEGRYVRRWSGVATAHVVLAEEFGKAPTDIQNLLLTTMEERLVETPEGHFPIPLHTLVAATNEGIYDNMAVWDRFQIKTVLKPIEDSDNILKMIESDQNSTATNVQLSDEDAHNLRGACTVISRRLTPITKAAIRRLFSEYAKELSLPVSDRRWKRLTQVAAGNALTKGRTYIDLEDIYMAAVYSLWHTPEEYEAGPVKLNVLFSDLGKGEEQVEDNAYELVLLLVNDMLSRVDNLNEGDIDNRKITQLYEDMKEIVSLYNNAPKSSRHDWKSVRNVITGFVNVIKPLYEKYQETNNE